MNMQFSREVMLLGTDGLARLQSAHVAVFGVGGVGSFTAEALARAGVGTITLVTTTLSAKAISTASSSPCTRPSGSIKRT